MTRLSTIYDFEQGGIRMIDIENMIKALRRREYMEDLLNVTFKRCRRTFYFWMQLYDKRSFRNINFFIENFCSGGQNSVTFSLTKKTC